MAQPSVINYFNSRKRSAVTDVKSTIARKVFVLDANSNNSAQDKQLIFKEDDRYDKVKAIPGTIANNKETKKPRKTITSKNITKQVGQKDIEQFLQIPNNPKPEKTKNDVNTVEELSNEPPRLSRDKIKNEKTFDDNLTVENLKEKLLLNKKLEDWKKSLNNYKKNEAKIKKVENRTDTSTKINVELCAATTSKNAMDKVSSSSNEMTLNEIKTKLTRSEKLAELKASISRFKESEKKLDKLEEKLSTKKDSPCIKTFKSIELEVQLSPQKVHSPQKLYLSPKKDSTAKRNILNVLSPTKNAVELHFSPNKLAYEIDSKSLYLPFKYKSLLEIFRSVDTVSQIMFNRHETITFKKLKPAVEKLLNRNLFERHLGQIKHIYPEAFDFRKEKLREFGTGIHQEKWELTVYPKITGDHITSELLVERRKKLHQLLIDKTKDYHNDFLKTIELDVPRDKITRWHPEFDIEKVPDIEIALLPKPPVEEKMHTGKEVLEKARSLFHCNTRMEAALERLEKAKETNNEVIPIKIEPSPMKGIPKALLEKVRQRQAAKALENMTRSTEKEATIQTYCRLPELARLTRNLFVAEKKSVLSLEIVLDKLGNSFRTFLTNDEIEKYLRVISAEAPGWLVFHEVRSGTYVKVSKNADLNLVLKKLETALKQKQAF